jgi:hypothetical protein
MSEQIYGPQTYQIEKLIIKIKSLTPEQIQNLDAARSAAWRAAWDAARSAAWDVAWDVAWDAAWNAARSAARDAALALVSRDLIGKKFTQAQYDLLTKPWRDVIGEFEEPETFNSKYSFDRTNFSLYTSDVIELQKANIISISEARYLIGFDK